MTAIPLEALRLDGLRASSLSPPEWRNLLAQADVAPHGHGDCVALRTCERLEVLHDSPTSRHELFHERLETTALVRSYRGSAALRYLIRSAAGLESRLLGESQIAGQLREAWQTSRGRGLSNSLLDLAVSRALRAGRIVRSELDLGRLSVGYSQLAVARLRAHLQRHGSASSRVVLLGSGRVALEIARSLRESRCALRIEVCTRHPHRVSEDLRAAAADTGGRVHDLERAVKLLDSADVVLGATASPRLLLTDSEIRRAAEKRRRPLLLLDLGSPANLGTTRAALVDRWDLDRLSEGGTNPTAQVLERADSLVTREMEHLLSRRWAPAPTPERRVS